MTVWGERLEATRTEFIEGLESRGWRLVARSELTKKLFTGEISHNVIVSVDADFPFAPPRVFPPADLPASWHRELDGAMCLYPETGRGSLPWLDVDDFVATIERWLEATTLGWPADAPDMDLERYFEPIQESLLVIYDEAIDLLLNRLVRFKVQGPRIELAGSGVKPRKASQRRHRLYGYVADIGEPERPPRSWGELLDLLDQRAVAMLEREARRGAIDLLLLRYSRGGAAGAIALLLSYNSDGISLRSVPSASNSVATLGLRGGRDAPLLSSKRVLVVGAGAIGSFICDYLARSGVGHITVRDPDILRPGNSVRHLAPPQLAGQRKAFAIKYLLERRPGNMTEVEVDLRPLRAPHEVPELLAEFDLVVDATADGAASAMLADAARTLGSHIISASLQDEGRIVRTDVIPPIGRDPIPAADLEKSNALVFEAGCGDPVSMTPPYAVNEAAGVASRLAVRLLLDPSSSGAGAVHVYA
ncbi:MULTISPECIES: ThiF family adenylyltransferase [unclassified Microbacterium]|uniref:ThiF family adenylyltransferase n=1 Tax=unclassified Microbacterium TaxID=2609290 RepID=UPI000DE29C67|nr:MULTISPECIES: ThiF family adenylyltransferase [unclassified Microbacterium]NYF29207.1 hypothetical protein [Microbacterium sp. JAI119]RBO71102.1 hypothetical protein DSP71_18325 [Microbacterium sp. H6]